MPRWRDLIVNVDFWIVMLCFFGPVLYCMWIMGMVG